jgi:hypothetical protein
MSAPLPAKLTAPTLAPARRRPRHRVRAGARAHSFLAAPAGKAHIGAIGEKTTESVGPIAAYLVDFTPTYTASSDQTAVWSLYPIGYVDGMGLYQYVNSMPLTLTDYLGLSGCIDFVNSLLGFVSQYNVPSHGTDLEQSGKVGAAIACAFVPVPHRYVLALTCPSGSYTSPTDITGFCPQLSMGGKNEQLYRHLAFNAGAVLVHLDSLADKAAEIDCEELRKSCGCPCPFGPATKRCWQNRAEVVGDLLGKKIGKILKDVMYETTSPLAARNALKALLCGDDCKDDWQHCCPAENPNTPWI